MSPDIFFLGNLRSARKHARPPAPLTPIDHLLAKPVDLSFSDASLQDLAHAIEEAVGCDVSIEQRPLEKAGIDLDKLLLTTQSHGVPLARFLDRVLPSYGLDWTAQDGGIQITSRKAASASLFAHVHDVSDFFAGADSLQTLENLVVFAIDSRTWEDFGGDGAISMDLAPDTAALVVRQTLAMQRRIADFLDGLRKFRAQPAAERQTLSTEGWWSDSERTVAIRAALARPVKGKVEFTEKPLLEVAESLTEASGVPVLVDKQACHDASIVLDDQRLSFTGRDLPLGRLLDRMLRDVGLAFVVDDDQLVITTVPAAAERVSVAIYPVDRFLAARRDLKGIATTLKATVAETTWDVMGGDGQVFAVGGDAPCLVVVQTTAGHRAVAEFLGSLK